MSGNSTKIEDLEKSIAKVKPFLRRFLEERDVDIAKNGKFRCINPKHEDKNPSCGFVPGTEETVFYCFSCSARGDILDAANLMEGKPIKGPEFVTDNLMYIADKYGITLDTVELTQEELKTLAASADAVKKQIDSIVL